VASVLKELKDPVVARYEARFAESRGRLPGARHGWVEELRGSGEARFVRDGLPDRHVESWKYTDLRPLLRNAFAPSAGSAEATAESLAPFMVDGAHVAVFVNGAFAPDLSRLDALPDGVRVGSLAAALDFGDEELRGALGQVVDCSRPGFAALNTALMQDGAVCRVADGVEVAVPIQLLLVTTEGFAGEAHLRNVLAMGEMSRATVVRTHAAIGASAGFCNVVTEAVIGAGAALYQATLQDEDTAAWHIALTAAELARDATCDSLVLSTGARLARNEIQVSLAGEGASCSLNGVALVRGRQHCDNTTEVDHAIGHCRSMQLYKNVLDERARSVFQGRIHVAPDAQKTDANQMNRNLLLSRDAQADSKPELVIHADDVKCSHGATVGDLDREAVFYLRSRGIDEVAARNMLVRGFAAEMLESVPDDAVRAHLDRALSGWLDRMTMEREAA
jgi:Fe-S cluster assembly protein SufD